MATLLGDGVFGIASDETGIITHKLKYEYSHDTVELDSSDNEVIGVAFSKEKVDIAIDGKIPATSPFSSLLGVALTLINSMPDHLQGSISAGTTYLDGVSRETDKGEYHDISVKAVYRPSLIVA
jgi:hypothetical protein